MKKYYRPDEVAEMLGVSTRTIYRWIDKKELSAIKIGGTVRVKFLDLEAWSKKV